MHELDAYLQLQVRGGFVCFAAFKMFKERLFLYEFSFYEQHVYNKRLSSLYAASGYIKIIGYMR